MKAKAKRLGLSEKHADHLAVCSCRGCGNPRKWCKEKTRQEIKRDYDTNDLRDQGGQP